MDEYRPYPTDQPSDEEQDETEETAEGTTARAPQPPQARTPSAPARDERDEDEDEDEDEEEDEGDEEEADREPARSGASRRAERAERAAPNLDHPGGHLTGTVARLNRPRRFGFLRTEDGMEIFFHASALESGPSSFDQLRSGQPVEFDCHQDEAGRGLAASLVQVVGPPPPESARPQRAPREERRGGRGDRAARDNWRVEILQERGEASVRSQLERLLNERGVKPGNFTLGLLEGQAGTECWVAYFTGDDKR
jgi:cold shock CspA family protein